MASESGGRASSLNAQGSQRASSEPLSTGSHEVIPSARESLAQAFSGRGGGVSAFAHFAFNPTDNVDVECEHPSLVASSYGASDYDMLIDYESVRSYLGRDLDGPSLRWPRLVSGAENAKVDVLHRFSDMWFIVRVVDTGVVGLASGVKYVPTSGRGLSDGSFESLLNMYKQKKQDTDGHSDWSKCAKEIIDQDYSEEARADRREDTLFHDLERISFQEDGSSMSPFPAYASYAVEQGALERKCVVMFCFMAHHWETLTIDEGAGGQDLPQIQAADVFLHGLVLVVNISYQSVFRYLKRSEAFVAIVAMLNRFAAFFLYPEFSARLLENQDVLDKLKASLPKKQHCADEMIKMLSHECCPGNMYLLFALIAVDGCLTAGGMSGHLNTGLLWNQLAENLNWKRTTEPAALLQAFARDCDLGFYSAFTRSCPVLMVVKRLYPEGMSVSDALLAAYERRPNTVYASAQRSARVWRLPPEDLEAVWILAKHAELNWADSTALLGYVDAMLCGTGDLQARRLVISLTASYHLDAAMFEAILDYAEKESAWQVLYAVYKDITQQDRTLKDKAISTVQQVLLDIYFHRSSRDSDSDSDSHRLVQLARGLDSDEGDERKQEQWAHLQTTLALFQGNVSKLYFPSNEALKTTLTVMCDRVVIEDRHRLSRPLLQRILLNIHKLVGQDPISTAEVVTKATQLSGYQLDSLTSAMDIPLLGNGLACVARRSCTELFSQALGLLETLAQSGEFAVAPGSAVIILCWSYCKWLGRACREFSHPDTVVQLGQLSAYASTLVQCTAVDGLLFSSLLADLELTVPTTEVLQNAQILAPLLAVTRSVWSEHVATGALPESALAGYKFLRDKMSDMQQMFALEDYPRDTWNQYKSRISSIDALLRALELPEVKSLDGWEAALSCYKTQSLVLQWLVEKAVPGSEELLGKLQLQFGDSATTLTAFHSTLNEVRSTMLSKLTGSVGGTSTTVADYITYTISRSKICRHYSMKFRACRQPLTPATWIECISKTVNDTFKYVSYLLDGTKPIGNVTKVVGYIVQEMRIGVSNRSHALHLLCDEMKVISSSPAHQSRGHDFDRLRRLLHLEIIREEKGMEHILKALLYRVPEDDSAIVKLTEYKSRPADDDQEFQSLQQADEQSRHVYELIKDLAAWHWDFFRLIATRNCTELLAFFRQVFDNEQDFEKRLAIANTRLQGDQRKSAWITTLLDVKSVMMAFCCPEETVAAIIDKLKAVSAVSATVLENAMHNLAVIQGTLNSVMESSFDHAKRDLAGLHKGSSVRARLFEDAEGVLQYECSYNLSEDEREAGIQPAHVQSTPEDAASRRKPQQLGKDQLEELQLCLPYFYHLPETVTRELDDEAAQDQYAMGRRDYEELFTKLSSLQQLHQSVSQLLDDGDIGFLLKLPPHGFPLSLESIGHFQHLADTHTKEWRTKLARLRKTCLFFRFVSNACVGQLLVQVRRWREMHATALAPVDTADDHGLHRLASTMLSHVTAMSSLVTVVDTVSLATIRRALSEATQRSNSDDAILEQAAQSLALRQSLLGVTEKAQVLCTVSPPSTVPASCSAAQPLMALLCKKLSGVQLCRAQIMFCSGATSEAELEHFFAVIAHSSGKKFALCGVDRLRSRCMSTVLRHQEDIDENKKLVVHVFYLFYDCACLKMWPTVPSVDIEQLPVASTADLKVCFDSVERHPSVCAVAVSGDAGVGKSRYIDHVCMERERRKPDIINLSSWRDFDGAARDLARLLGLAAVKDYAAFESVAFRVAPNADLDMVNQFFFEVLWCQSLTSLSNRSIFSVPATVEARWNWFVELPDVLFQQEAKGAESITALPFIGEAVDTLETVTEESFPLQLDDTKQKLAAIVLEESTEGLGRPKVKGSRQSLQDAWMDLFLYEHEDRKNIDEATAISQLQGLVKRTGHRRHSRVEQLFIMDYIYRKWTTVEKCDTFRENVATYWNLAQEVFKQYQQEALFYCQESTVCNFRQFNQKLLLFDGIGAFQVLASKPLSDADQPVLDPRIGEGDELAWLRFHLDSLARRQSLLCWSFNLVPSQVKSLLTDEQFVLTEDFAFKLVAIHERKKLGKPLILEGETGSGKSFLLKTYTSLMNYEAIKDTGLLHLMNRWLYNLVRKDLWTMMSHKVRRWYAGGDTDNFLDEVNRKDFNLEHMLARDECNATDLSEIWKKLLFENPNLGALAKEKLRSEIRALIAKLTLLKPVSNAVLEALRNDHLTDDETCQLIHDWLDTEQKSLFKKMLVHPGVTKADVVDFVKDLANLVRGTGIRAVGFFDEVNTASCIDVFKELIVNLTIDGKAPELVEQIFFVAAINPHCGFNDLVNLGFFELPLSSRSEEGERWQEELGLQYLVNPLPKSMLHYRWKYQSLTERDEVREYTRMKIGFLTKSVDLRLGGEEVNFSDAILNLLSSFLFHSYDYCGVRVSKRFVSQRDVQRVFKLIPYFWRIEDKWYLRKEHERENSQPDNILQKCILQAIAMVFYLRLPERACEVKYDRVCRSDFDACVTASVREEMDGRYVKLSLKSVLMEAINDFVTEEHFVIPEGVALTSALKENIYCMVACTQQRIPLGIIGEPGSSKTLACQIVCGNMRGINSDRELCRILVSVDSFFCQCSPDTTTEQIQSVFKGAIDRQVYHTNAERKADPTHIPVRSKETQFLFDFHDVDERDGQQDSATVPRREVTATPKAALPRTNVAVLIDEAGLPSMKQNRMVMKVLHKYLDEPDVAFIALSNHWFDAANTNRMLTVFRSHATSADLVILAHGCISRPMADGMDDDDDVTCFIRGVCSGYEQVRLKFPDWFHQRDLISLFRSLRRRQLKLGKKEISIEARDLCEAIEENFNGYRGTAIGDVVDVFFSEVTHHLRSFRAEGLSERDSMQIAMDLKSELEESVDIDNTSSLAMRYMMMIDDYGCDYALLDMLKHVRFLDDDASKTRVFQLANLSDGADELQCTTALAKIRQSLAQPCTVVIVNSPMLHGYLYELLNQSYQTITVNDEKCAYSNIAMKDSTFPCQVHRHFRCIVLLSRELACRERTPFLSRFAKFGVHPSDARQYVSKRMQASTVFGELRSTCLRLCGADNVDESMFLGCGRDGSFQGTVDCLSLGQLVADTFKSFSIRSQHTVEMRRDMISRLFRLLPLERFLLHMPRLAPVYGDLYFMDALHSTLRGLVQFAVDTAKRTKSHFKYLAVCKSPTRITHRFLSSSAQQLEEYMGKQLSSEVTVKSCRQLESVLRAEQAVEEFMTSEKFCLILAVDAVKGVNTMPVLSALKQLVDGQLALWRASSRDRKPKVIVLLLHSLPHTADNLTWCSFLSGWRTQLVAIIDPTSFSPLDAFTFLAAAGVVPYETVGRSDTDNVRKATRAWLREMTHQLAKELALRFPWRSMSAMYTTQHSSRFPQLFPPGAAEVDHLKAMEFLFEKTPFLLDWATEEFATWVKHECRAQVSAFCEQARPGGTHLNLLHMIQQWQDEKIRDILLFSTRVALTGGNWEAMLDSSREPSLVSKLMRFVVAGEDLHTAWFQPAAADVKTPFFFHVNKHVQTLAQRLEDCTVDKLDRLLAADQRVSLLCSEEVNFLDCYAGDVIRTVCCWTGEGRCIDLMCVYLKKAYKSLPQPKTRTKYMALVHLMAASSRSLLLAMLNGCEVLLQLDENEFKAKKTAKEIETLFDSTAVDDLPMDFATMLVKKLWEKLRMWAMGAAHESAGEMLERWRCCFDQLCLYWPFADGCRDEQWSQEIREVLIEIRSYGTWSKHLRLMTFSSIALQSVRSLPATRQLAEVVQNYVDIENPLAIVSAGSFGAGMLVEKLLRTINFSLTPALQLDTHQMRVFCVRWMASMLEGNESTDASILRVIFQCISCVDRERCIEMEPRMPPALAAASMRRAEKQQNDARLKKKSSGAVTPSNRLDAIQACLNDCLKQQLNIDKVNRQTGDYIIARFYPSDFPESLNASHPISASGGNQVVPAGELTKKKEDTAFSLSVNHGFYRLACHIRRTGGSGLSELVPEAKLKSTCTPHVTVGWVIKMRATTQVAFEAAAMSLANYVRRLQESESRGDSAMVKFDKESSVSELLKDHRDGKEWPLFLRWWILYLAPLDGTLSAMQRISTTWAKACEECCRSMEVLRDSRGQIRLGCVDDFARYQKVNDMRECIEDLVEAVTKTGFRSGSTLTKISGWLAKTRSTQPQKTSKAEACVFLKLSLDYFSTLLQSDFNNLCSLCSTIGVSDLLKRSLTLLFDMKDGRSENKLAELMCSSAEDDVAVRDILLETLAVVLMIPPDNHLHACVINAPAMKDGTYMFAATSARYKPFGVLPDESLDDHFFLSRDKLPGCLSEMEVCSSVLSLLGYVLAGIQMYAALCWNALLYPQQEVWAALVKPDTAVSASSEHHLAWFVEHCVSKIATLYRLLPCANLNAAPLGRKLLVLTSLQCFCKVANEQRTVFRSVYKTSDERVAAELVFRDDVCPATLRAYSADMQEFLRTRVSEEFADMHRLQMSTAHDNYSSMVAGMPAEFMASRFPPALDCTGIVCCLAADKHGILAEALANRRIYSIIGGVASVIEYYHGLRERLSNKLTFRLVVEERITLQDALHLVSSSRQQRSKSDFAEILGSVKEILKVLRQHDANWRPSWTEWDERNLSLQTELVELVNFGGRGSGKPILYHLVTRLLQWQDRLLEVCDCADNRLQCAGDDSSQRPPRDVVHISDIAKGQHQGLVQLSEHTVDELIALFCPVTWNEYWTVDADLPRMEQSLITQVVSQMKKVDWSEDELRFSFANIQESWEAHLEWVVGATEPLTTDQKHSIVKAIPDLVSGSSWSFSQALRKLAHDRLQLPAGLEFFDKSSLKNLAVHCAGKALCEDISNLPGSLTVGNLIPLLRCVERHRDDDSLITSAPPGLRRLVSDEAGLLQAVEDHFQETAAGVQQAAEAVNDLSGIVSSVETRATQPLVSIVREARPQCALRDFLDTIRPSVDLLGVHYAWLMGTLMARVKALEVKMTAQSTGGAVDRDPCGIVAIAADPAENANTGLLKVRVNVQQRGNEERVTVQLRKERNEKILKTLHEAIQTARKDTKAILFYKCAGDEEPFYAVDDGELGAFVGDGEDEVEMLVVHN